MTLTEQEKLKFYELAEYAKTQADTAIRSGWLLAMHKFKLSGSYNDNGSFSVDHFYVGEAHSFDEVNAFSINTDGSVSSDSLIPDRRHSAEEKRAVLIKEIAYWMAYKIPGK